jgi:hypothetical protein
VCWLTYEVMPGPPLDLEQLDDQRKLFGTLVVPGGLALPVYVSLVAGYTESCGGPVGGRPGPAPFALTRAG